MAAETVKVDTMTAIAKINPMELMIERALRLERFLPTKVKVRKEKSLCSMLSCELSEFKESKERSSGWAAEGKKAEFKFCFQTFCTCLIFLHVLCRSVHFGCSCFLSFHQ